MRKRLSYTILAMLLLVNANLSAQYSDHRNRRVDSLEQVLATHPPTGEDLLRIYFALAWGYQQSDVEKSMNYARKSIELTISSEDWDRLTDAYGILAVDFYTLSRYDSAIVYYNKSLETVDKMREFPERYTEFMIDNHLSSTYGNMGNTYNIQGMYHEAIDYYGKALKIFERRNWPEHQTIAYSNIGQMYMTMENWEQAENHLLKADSLAHVSGDSLMIVTAKHGLSRVFLHNKEYDRALENAMILRGYYFAHPEEGEQRAVTLNLLAQIRLEGYNDIAQAEDEARKALKLAKEMDIPREIAVSLTIISTIHLKRSEWRKAEQTALEALAADNSDPSNTLSLYDILSKVYIKLGDSNKAWEYMDKHKKLQSSWSTKHYQSAIRDMEVKYETEKKEAHIATLEDERQLMIWLGIAAGAVLLLALAAFFFLWRWTVQKKHFAENQKELAEQEKQFAEQKIKQLEQEKQLVATQAVLDGEIQERIRLARDLHDGLGSILAVAKYNLVDIKHISTLDEKDVDCYNKAVSLLDDSMSEMRRVSHHLMPDALSRVGLKQSVADFCNTIPIVKFSYYGDDTHFDPKLEVMVYRILHELVTNAVKHAEAENILVQIVRESDRIAISVQDDGCGFDLSAESKGMGLRNIRSRVESFKGNLDIDSKLGEGTGVRVELRMEN